MRKKFKVVLFLFITIIVISSSTMIYFLVFPEDKNIIENKVVLLSKKGNTTITIESITDPYPAKISFNESALYRVKLNIPCEYDKSKINVTGPAKIVNIYKEDNVYIIKVKGKDKSGNVTLNIEEGAFFLNDVASSKAEKNGLFIDNTDFLRERVLLNFANNIDKVSVVYYDINSSTGFEINSDKPYFPASVSKLHTVTTLYDLALKGEVNIDDSIYYMRQDYEGGAGIIQGMNRSNPFKLTDLGEYAIIHSDNIAYRMLFRYLGSDRIHENYESIVGHPITKTLSGTMQMSAKDAFLLLKNIYDNPNNNTYYNDLLKHMKNTTSTNNIMQYLPCIVARKGGNYASYNHDAAIVFDGDNPYILTIFSQGVINPNENISQIAKYIHENR